MNAADENKKKGSGFAAADADKDGKVTEAEYVAAMKGRGDDEAAKRRFAQLDTDKDGSLSQQEYNAGAKKGEGKGSGEKKKKDAN